MKNNSCSACSFITLGSLKFRSRKKKTSLLLSLLKLSHDPSTSPLQLDARNGRNIKASRKNRLNSVSDIFKYLPTNNNRRKWDCTGFSTMTPQCAASFRDCLKKTAPMGAFLTCPIEIKKAVACIIQSPVHRLTKAQLAGAWRTFSCARFSRACKMDASTT